MKKVLWPIIHKFQIHNNFCLIKYPWGWMPNSEINKLKFNIPKTEYSLYLPIDWKERQKYYKTHLDIKVNEIYSSIFISYFNNEDFIEKNYLTPKLSNAINFFNDLKMYNKIEIEIPKIDLSYSNPKILGSWISIGNSTCNNNFLGLWDINQINHEIFTGIIGPEIKYVWDQQPIKQNVRILFEFNDRFDVWDFERCLMSENTNWKVCNINNILV